MTERWTEAMVAEYQRKMREAGRVPLVIEEPKPPKPSKYRNKKTADGFDSEKERRVWQELKLREHAGEITGLVRQTPFALVVNGIHIADYRADFCYMEGRQRVTVDVKSPVSRRLPVYRIKKKLMQACHGIEIQEL